nr:hypothetical protein [Candidatus Sigynarchaeota archaeon]
MNNPTIVHVIIAGITLILMDLLLHGLVGAGLIAGFDGLIVLGNWLFGIGAALILIFSILFFLEVDFV